MATIGFMGLSLYLFIRKNPNESKSMFAHATDIVKYMPVDRSSADILTPFLDFTNQKSFFKPNVGQQGSNIPPQQKRMMKLW